MSKGNNKSTGKQQVVYVALPKLPQIPKQSRSAVKNSNVKSHDLVYKSKQPKSRKSPNGSSYNDGFDVVNSPVKPKVRYEDFDEICYTLNGSINYSTSKIPLNPAQASYFPRISNFAKLYDRYKFTKCEIYFQHDVSQFASQGSKGLVILSALYDAASPGPDTKQEQEMCNPHVIGMPNQNILLRMDPARMHPSGYPLFTRNGLKPGGTDIKTYDAGNVFVGCQGMIDSTEVGEIHIRGTVAFYDEIVDTNHSVFPSQTSLSEFGSSVAEAVTTGVEHILSMDDEIVNGLQIAQVGGTFTLPPGDYSLHGHSSTNNTTGALTYLQLRFLVDQVAYGQYDISSLPAITTIGNSVQAFVRSDGTTTVKLAVLATFATGTTGVFGQLDITIL